MKVFVNSPNTKYTENFIESVYEYQTTFVEETDDQLLVTPHSEKINIQTYRKVPKLGVMLVGWGGNNGSTFTAALIMNKLRFSWPTRNGTQHANWFGSITQSSTLRLGNSINGDAYADLKSMLPMVDPDNIVIDGWDISNWNLFQSAERACVLEPFLQQKLQTYMEPLTPRASIYNSNFINKNQDDRANNTIGGTKLQQVNKLCEDIADFKRRSKVDQVIVLWTAGTERYSSIIPGVNDTYLNIKEAIKNNHDEISPSTLFAYASISMKCTFINGSPQNTFVPGILDMAETLEVSVAGSDFKSGQTKLKSVIVDFLISAGIKPVSIVSYNHLGNNDGKNLDAHEQFKSKEISKSGVVEDMVESNRILYKPGEKPDHCVVIKYVPYVGDSKRAMDEYVSEIMLGGLHTIAVYNTCEDSLLAVPIMLDLVILAELCSRIQFKRESESTYTKFHSVLSILSYLCKAPLVPNETPVVNSLFRQRSCIENVLRACIGLPPESNMLLEHKALALMKPVHEKCIVKKAVKNNLIPNGNQFIINGVEKAIITSNGV